MNWVDWLNLGLILFLLGLMLIYAAVSKERTSRALRVIPAFEELRRAIGLAVEAGKRLHLSLGWGALTTPRSAVSFIGLSVLRRVARATSMSDLPPIATAGEATLTILSQDALQSAARFLGGEFEPTQARLSGLTPLTFAAGALCDVHDESIGASVLIGSFGSEVALIHEASERSGALSLTASDQLPAQAVAYVTAQESLIGEEAFASGAYLGAGALHIASLRAQDVVRWLLILAVLSGAILKLLGVL